MNPSPLEWILLKAQSGHRDSFMLDWILYYFGTLNRYTFTSHFICYCVTMRKIKIIEIFIICLCHLDHFLLWTVALYGFNFRKRFIVNSKDHHLIFQPLRYAVSVSRHIHMTKKYLCTVGVFCCLTLYYSTGDHTCCFIVWPMASPAYEAQEYSPPAGTIILPSALWHFPPPHSFHSAALTHNNSLAYLCSNSRTPCWTFPLQDRELWIFQHSLQQFSQTGYLYSPASSLSHCRPFLHYRSWIALSDTSL